MRRALRSLCCILVLVAGLAGCSNPAVERVADVVGGGALPPPRYTIFDGPSEENSRKLRRRSTQGVSEAGGGATELGGNAPEVEQKSVEDGYYFGRKVKMRGRAARDEVEPSFAADGTCVHCDGRGYLFGEGDYVVCAGCGGLGRE